jgi:hypothetical protein
VKKVHPPSSYPAYDVLYSVAAVGADKDGLLGPTRRKFLEHLVRRIIGSHRVYRSPKAASILLPHLFYENESLNLLSHPHCAPWYSLLAYRCLVYSPLRPS